MDNNKLNFFDPSTKVSLDDSVKSALREYSKPELIYYGDVRDITLGGSGDTFESGAMGQFGGDGCRLNGQPNRSCLS